MRLRQIVLGLGITGVCLLAAPGCGDNAGLECGPGTVQRDQACRPDTSVCGDGTQFDEATGTCEPTSSNCARGTVADGDACIPDGTVICDDGTTYNASSGQCQADISGCGPGTVLDGLICIPLDDVIEASEQEASEPNDTDGLAGQLTVPSFTSVRTIYGCIEPVDVDGNGSLDIDRDSYRLTASGPAVIDVSVDGIDGLSGAFEIRAASGPLQDDGWSRMGLNLVSDISQRQVFLPAAGDYLLREIVDGRSLLTQEPAGGPNTCYFVAIRNLVLPSATQVTDIHTGTLGGAPHFLSFTPQADGDILTDALQMSSPTGAASLAIVHMRDGRYAGNAQGGPSLNTTTSGLRETSNIIIVVEPEFDYTLTGVDYDYSLASIATPELGDGNATRISVGGGPGLSMAWTTVDAGEMLRLRANNPEIRIVSLDDELNQRTLLCNGCANSEFLYQPTQSGLLYIGVEHRTLNTDFDITVEQDRFAIAPLQTDSVLSDIALGADGFDFFETIETALSWTLLEASPVDFGGTLQANRYSRSHPGFLDFELPMLESIELNDASSRAHISETFQSSLWHFLDDAFDGTADTETYNVSLSSRDFTDLQPTGAGAVALTSLAIVAGDQHRYLLQAVAGDTVEIVTSTADAIDLSINQLSDFEGVTATQDAAGSGGTETVQIVIPAKGYVPLIVLSDTGDGAYDLTATVLP